jgi:hypothetical protein
LKDFVTLRMDSVELAGIEEHSKRVYV